MGESGTIVLFGQIGVNAYVVMTTVQQLHEHPIEREMVRLSNASLSMSFST